MTDLLLSVKQSIMLFYKELASFPQDSRQIAWNMATVAFARNDSFGSPDSRAKFYALYDKWLDLLTNLGVCTDHVYTLLRDPYAIKGKEEAIEIGARQMHRCLKAFSSSFVPDKLGKTAHELAEKCAALCGHFEEHRIAEANDKLSL